MKITFNGNMEMAQKYVEECRKFKSEIRLTAGGRFDVDAKDMTAVCAVFGLGDLDTDITGLTIKEQNDFVDLMRQDFMHFEKDKTDEDRKTAGPMEIPAIRSEACGIPFYTSALNIGRIIRLAENETQEGANKESMNGEEMPADRSLLLPIPLVLAVYGNDMEWSESETGTEGSPSHAYGFIRLTGKETVEVLSGCSRIAAIRNALEKNKKLEKAEIPVILIEGQTEEECAELADAFRRSPWI